MMLDKALKNSQSYFTKKDKKLKPNCTKLKAMVTINISTQTVHRNYTLRH